MPISFPFLLFAKPAQTALRWIRLDLGPPPANPPLGEAEPARLERALAGHLPPRLKRDVLRDE